MKRRQAPYDAFIMEHIRSARNYCVLEHVNRETTGFNPLCGDRFTVQLRVARGRVEAAAFQCECCGISMASASMMTEWVTGRTVAQARPFVRGFAGRLADRSEAPMNKAGQMERALLTTVRKYPGRAGCAVLPWTTLETLLDERKK